jgi:hypothetical protein
MPASRKHRTVVEMAPGDRRTFFVESYVPQLDATAAAALSSRLRAVVEQLRDEGLTLSWIRSFVLLDEDTYVWMVEAAEVDDVVLVQRRAGLRRDHIVEAVSSETPGHRYPPPRRTSER